MTANRNRSTTLDQEVSRQVKIRIATSPEVSISSLARDLDMRRATLSARVNGAVPFAPSLLSQVARRLNASASEIVSDAEKSLSAEGAQLKAA